MKIHRKNDYFYRNYVLERWKDVNSNKKDATLFYSCTYFVRGIMKINGKNDYFYRNYVLERCKHVNSHKKDATLFYSCTYFVGGRIMRISLGIMI